MSRADGLRIWRDYLADFENGVALDRPALEVLLLVLETSISEIETLEQPLLLDRLNAKIARAQAVMAQADAVCAGVRAGKVALLPRYRAGQPPCGDPGDGGAA